MNRNHKTRAVETTRKTYLKVKKMDREQFDAFCIELYKNGYEDGRKSVPGIDVEKILETIAAVKGIGPKKMEEIRDRVNKEFEEKKEE